MKKLLSIITITLCVCRLSFAQQTEKPINFIEIAEKQAEAMMKRFKLNDLQVFLIDSVLQHDLPMLSKEIEIVKKSGASNSSSFQSVSDKWMNTIDNAFEKILTKEQWLKYMKSPSGKEKKKRDKRLGRIN